MSIGFLASCFGAGEDLRLRCNAWSFAKLHLKLELSLSIYIPGMFPDNQFIF